LSGVPDADEKDFGELLAIRSEKRIFKAFPQPPRRLRRRVPGRLFLPGHENHRPCPSVAVFITLLGTALIGEAHMRGAYQVIAEDLEGQKKFMRTRAQHCASVRTRCEAIRELQTRHPPYEKEN
jgi:hypothetical protein